MEKVVIIAEVGVNHNGSMEKAKLLIDAAKHAGADYVKFQTFKTELNILSPTPQRHLPLMGYPTHHKSF